MKIFHDRDGNEIGLAKFVELKMDSRYIEVGNLRKEINTTDYLSIYTAWLPDFDTEALEAKQPFVTMVTRNIRNNPEGKFPTYNTEQLEFIRTATTKEAEEMHKKMLSKYETM